MTKLLIDATCLCDDRYSGISQFTAFMTKELAKKLDIKLLKPFNLSTSKLNDFSVDIGSVLPPSRILNYCSYLRIPIKADLYIGKGVYWFPNYRHFSLSSKSKKIVSIYDLVHIYAPDTMTPKNKIFVEKAIPLAITQADIIHTISNTVKMELLENFEIEPTKIIVAPPGVNTILYAKKSHEEVEFIKQRLGIKNDYIMFVGSAEPRKNISRQLDAFADLNKGLLKKTSFVIISGKSWMSSELMQKINRLKNSGVNIVMPNFFIKNEDVATLMSGAELLTIASLYEGFGMPILEAQACKTPVVTSGVSCMPEVAGKDGALFVDPRKASSITAAYRKILTDKSLANRLRRVGHINATQYSWSNSAEILANAIKKIEAV